MKVTGAATLIGIGGYIFADNGELMFWGGLCFVFSVFMTVTAPGDPDDGFEQPIF